MLEVWEETRLAKADFPKRHKKLIRLLKSQGFHVLGHVVKHFAFKINPGMLLQLTEPM